MSTTDQHTRDNPDDRAALGQFVPDRVTLFRCPCSTESRALYSADRRGRIVADPGWSTHRTVICGHCGRYGQLALDDPDNGAVPVLGVAPLPAGCADCGAERGAACRDPFCPGQDVLDVDFHSILEQPGSGEKPAAEPVVYTVAALLTEVASTTRIWRYWASQAIVPAHPYWRRDRAGALRAAAQATVEAWRLRRSLRRGPDTIATGTEIADFSIKQLLDYLDGHGGPELQGVAGQALRRARSWSLTAGAALLDAAAIWRDRHRAPL